MRPASILLLPLSTFLNIQSARIPGWLASHSFFNHCAANADIHYVMDSTIKNMVSISAISGIIGTLSLFFRLLLEKKIKACTRIIVAASAIQGIFSGWALLMFMVQYSSSSVDLVVTEAPFYTGFVVFFSFWTVALLLQLQEKNQRTDHYNYLMDLSPSFRQLVLLIISSMSFMLLMAETFCWVENWDFDDSLYWVISTLTTIGYGDFTPKSILGKVLLIFFALPELADQYAKFLNVEEDSNLPDISHDILSNHQRRSSEGNIRFIPDFTENVSKLSIQIPKGSKAGQNGDFMVSKTPRIRRKTLVVSRGEYFPSLTVVGGHDLKKREIQRMTRNTIKIQIGFALLFEFLNVSIFGGFFALVEGWNFFEGVYFAVTSLLTIGYGDYILCGVLSRSVFIWYVFFGIASSTYLLAMLAESAFDQWSVTVQKIEKRVGRYEKKAELKRLYKSKSASRETSEGLNDRSSRDDYISIESPHSPRMVFPRFLKGLPFTRKKAEPETDSDSELLGADRISSLEGDTVDAQPLSWSEVNDLESTSLIGNPEIV